MRYLHKCLHPKLEMMSIHPLAAPDANQSDATVAIRSSAIDVIRLRIFSKIKSILKSVDLYKWCQAFVDGSLGSNSALFHEMASSGAGDEPPRRSISSSLNPFRRTKKTVSTRDRAPPTTTPTTPQPATPTTVQPIYPELPHQPPTDRRRYLSMNIPHKVVLDLLAMATGHTLSLKGTHSILIHRMCLAHVEWDNCKLFMETVEKQAEALGKKEEKESKQVDAAAGELEKLSVGENKGEEKAKEKASTAADEKEKYTETKTEFRACV